MLGQRPLRVALLFRIALEDRPRGDGDPWADLAPGDRGKARQEPRLVLTAREHDGDGKRQLGRGDPCSRLGSGRCGAVVRVVCVAQEERSIAVAMAPQELARPENAGLRLHVRAADGRRPDDRGEPEVGPELRCQVPYRLLLAVPLDDHIGPTHWSGLPPAASLGRGGSRSPRGDASSPDPTGAAPPGRRSSRRAGARRHERRRAPGDRADRGCAWSGGSGCGRSPPRGTHRGPAGPPGGWPAPAPRTRGAWGKAAGTTRREYPRGGASRQTPAPPRASARTHALRPPGGRTGG